MPLLVVGRVVVVSMITAKQPTCTQYRVSQWGGSVGRWRQNGDSTTTQRKSACAVVRTEIGKTRGEGR